MRFSKEFLAGVWLAVSACHAVAGSFSSDKDFQDSADRYCMKFEQIVRNEVAPLLMEMEREFGSPDDFFQKSGCIPRTYTSDTRAPMLHLVSDAVATREEFAEVVFKYYTIRRKDASLWLKAVNAVNEIGETTLDYLQSRIEAGKISSEETMQSAMNIRRFLCAKGGIYLRYPLSCNPADELAQLAEIQRSAEAGDIRAQRKLGFAYQYGWLGLRKNPDQAASWYRKAAERGDWEAIGKLYRYKPDCLPGVPHRYELCR